MILKDLKPSNTSLRGLWHRGHGKGEHFKALMSVISLVITQSKSWVEHFSSEVVLGPEKGDVPSTTIITYLVSSRRSIEIWQVCKIYGR